MLGMNTYGEGDEFDSEHDLDTADVMPVGRDMKYFDWNDGIPVVQVDGVIWGLRADGVWVRGWPGYQALNGDAVKIFNPEAFQKLVQKPRKLGN